MTEIFELILDALIDTLKLIPFLYLTYLLMEFIEHRGAEKAEKFISASGRLGPLVGGALGVVPQCGFSAAASGLYAGKIITAGTLIAVFLSTSDEMLPIMISNKAAASDILMILGIKLAVGVAVGFTFDFTVNARKKHKAKGDCENTPDSYEGDGTANTRANTRGIHEICECGHCHCEKNIFFSALLHTLQIILFIFVASVTINVIIYLIGEDTVSGFINSLPFVGEIIAATVGLIPNCASSVIITQLYLDGLIGAGPMLSGLLTGSGLGLLVLFRTNKNLRENLTILGVLYATGIIAGFLIGLLI